MLRNFCAGQNTRALMLGEKSSPVLERLQPAFQKVFENDVRGTLLSDIWAADPDDTTPQYDNTSHKTPLDGPTYELFEAKLNDLRWPPLQARLSAEVFSQRSIRRRQARFSVSSVSLGDSQVVFGDYPDGDWSAGRIEDMFVWPKGGRRDRENRELAAFCLVKTFKPLSEDDAVQDPYRVFGPTGGRLFYEGGYQTTVLHIDEIKCHFAGIARKPQYIQAGCLHVLPLDR